MILCGHLLLSVIIIMCRRIPWDSWEIAPDEAIIVLWNTACSDNKSPERPTPYWLSLLSLKVDGDMVHLRSRAEDADKLADQKRALEARLIAARGTDIEVLIILGLICHKVYVLCK